MDVKILAEGLHPLERRVLPFLSKCKSMSELVQKTSLQEIEVSRALQWLENKEVIKIKKHNHEIIELGVNGKKYLKESLPEKQFLKAIEKEPLTLSEVSAKSGLSPQEVNISLGILKSKLAIKLGDKISITGAGKSLLNSVMPEEDFLAKLPKEKETLDSNEIKILNLFMKRKELVRVSIKKERFIELSELGRKLINVKISGEMIDCLTPNIIKNKSWENKKFRRYDVEINVPKIYPGKRHFVNEAKRYAKQIWLDMGFKEMKGSIINSSFWTFDALFTAQDHPVREMQDTFFLKGKSKLPSKELVDKVKRQHEKGWKYTWDEKIAQKPVLRTHTTVLSAKTLSKLKKKDLPAKFFAIGRNYRNEAVDWSHLFEFNQSEGIVIDENANFKHLLGYLKEFFGRMGYDKVRFRPAYFAYTEPSVEVDVYIKEKNKWIELGGAGIFRPEVVKPLMGEFVPVLAWGFGLGRIILPYYGLKDLRDFYKNDLKQLKEMKSWI